MFCFCGKLIRTHFHWKSYMENNDSDENNFNKVKVNIKKLDMIWVLGRKLIKELNWPSGKKESSQCRFLLFECILLHVLWIHFWMCVCWHIRSPSASVSDEAWFSYTSYKQCKFKRISSPSSLGLAWRGSRWSDRFYCF